MLLLQVLWVMCVCDSSHHVHRETNSACGEFPFQIPLDACKHHKVLSFNSTSQPSQPRGYCKDGPTHLLAPTVGSLISAAHFPQGLCRTPRYVLFLPLDTTPSSLKPRLPVGAGMQAMPRALSPCSGKFTLVERHS